VPGDFTDDTDQMLLILENFLENQGKFDHVQFADNLLRWAYSGFPELGDTGGMGIGATVSAVLRHEGTLTVNISPASNTNTFRRRFPH
jgi:ADP-ribosylglycohydrolase